MDTHTLVSLHKDGSVKLELNLNAWIYYPNGSKKKHKYNTISHIIEEKWYENGQLKKHASYNASSKFDGRQEQFYLNGKSRSLSFYKNGMQHGYLYSWDEEGQLRLRCLYEHNNVVQQHIWNSSGVVIEYMESNGKFEELDNPNNDNWMYDSILVKDHKKWNEDGILVYHMEMTHTNPFSFSVYEYFNNGCPESLHHIIIENNKIKLHGSVTYWFPNGRISAYKEYDNDVSVKSYMWHDNGQMSFFLSKTPPEEGLHIYDRKGCLLSISQHKDGYVHGFDVSNIDISTLEKLNTYKTSFCIQGTCHNYFNALKNREMGKNMFCSQNYSVQKDTNADNFDNINNESMDVSDGTSSDGSLSDGTSSNETSSDGSSNNYLNLTVTMNNTI